MSDYMMNQIHSCFTKPEDYIYEVMKGAKKFLLDVHGDSIPIIGTHTADVELDSGGWSALSNASMRGMSSCPFCSCPCCVAACGVTLRVDDDCSMIETEIVNTPVYVE